LCVMEEEIKNRIGGRRFFDFCVMVMSAMSVCPSIKLYNSVRVNAGPHQGFDKRTISVLRNILQVPYLILQYRLDPYKFT
jgi:hypothetical protein